MNKLKKYTLSNYQNHKNSVLNFHPGVNIVSGSSRNGKSSLLRGLHSAFKNRPGGYEYKPHNAAKSCVTSSIVEFDDLTLIKERSDTINTYELIKDGKSEKFKKFGQSVPDEIEQALNLKDYNFQSQHSQYFLLQNSGSEVAARINEIAGLQIIDTAQSNAKTFVNSAKAETDVSKTQIKKDAEKIESLKFLDEVEPIIKQIDNDLEEKENLASSVKELELLIDRIEILESQKEKLDKFLKVKPIYKELKKDIDKQSKIVLEYQELEKLISKISDFEGRIQENVKILTVKEDVLTIQKDILLLKDLKEDEKKLTEIVTNIEKLSTHKACLDEWLEVKKDSAVINELISEYNSVNNLITEHSILSSQIMNAEKKSKYLTKLIADKELEKKEIIKSMGVCLLCHQEIK